MQDHGAVVLVPKGQAPVLVLGIGPLGPLRREVATLVFDQSGTIVDTQGDLASCCFAVAWMNGVLQAVRR